MTARNALHTLSVALLVLGTLGSVVLVDAPTAAEVAASGKVPADAEVEVDDAVGTAPAVLAVWSAGEVLSGLPESARSGARAAPPTPPPEV